MVVEREGTGTDVDETDGTRPRRNEEDEDKPRKQRGKRFKVTEWLPLR